MDIEDDGYDDELDDELDDDEAPKKKRVATSTKIVLVVAGWLLLTLFLIGEFSKNKTEPDTAGAELEATTPEFDDGGTPDVVDTDAEAEFDLDGDGFLDETERTAAIEAFEASVEAGEVAIGESDISGSESGGGGGTYPGPDGETATPAVPGAAPSSGGSTGGGASSTTTTAKPGGGGGGGSPTTTAAPTTTKPGNSPTTTASPTTTTAPPPPSGQAETYTVRASGLAYVYAGSDVKNLVLFRGSKIKFDNTEGNNGTFHSFTIENGWDSGLIRASDTPVTMPDPLAQGTYNFACKNHPSMNGTLTVT